MATETYNFGYQLLSFVVVIISGAIGGFLISALSGIHVGKFLCFKGFTIKPLLKKVSLPPLVGMVIMGSVSRSFFSTATVAFNDRWASII